MRVALMVTLCYVCSVGGIGVGRSNVFEEEEDRTPKKCCAPQTFEVEIKATGNMDYGIPEFNKQIIQLIYDYANNRWALNQTVPKNPSYSARMVFDYNAGKKYMIDDTGCRAAQLEGNMVPLCVAENATFYGDHSYSRPGFQLPFSVWGWELKDAPIRVMSKVSRDNCFPLQDDIFQLKDSSYTYMQENPACIPWVAPQAVRDGDCYKCYVQIPMKKPGKSITHHASHMQYANYFHGLHRLPHFQVPEDCREAKEWGLDMRYNAVQKFFILRFKE